MAEIIKIRCSGPNRHVNEVDLSEALREQPIARLINFTTPDIPDRIVLHCHECADGKVILTRAMIEQARQRHS
jgi:hypothetical protein